MKNSPCRKCNSDDCSHKRGGRNRAAHMTKEFQQSARAHVKTESLRESGRRGWRATAAKHGYDCAARVSANWRRTHPSKLEQIVMRWLDEAGEYYLQEEHLKNNVYPDLTLPSRNLVVEVDGAIWHRNDALHGEDREGRDTFRERIIRGEGFRLLRLCDSCIADGTGKQMLYNALHQEA